MTASRSTDEALTDIPPRNRGAVIWTVLGRALVWLVLFSVVDAAFFQMEMILTGGLIPIRPSWNSCLVVAVGMLFLLRRRINKNPLFFGSAVLTVYCIVDAIYLSMSLRLSLDEIHGALEYMAPVVLLGLIGSLSFRLKSRDVLIPLTVFLVPCLLVSVAQFITDSPVVYAASLDGFFNATAIEGEGVPRAFSLFVSGLQAGILYCFTGALGMSLVLTKRKRLLGLFLLLASALGCYTSLTRLMLISFAFAIFATFVLQVFRRFRITVWLPILSFGVGILTIFETFFVANGFGRNDLANTYSMALRLDEWVYYWRVFTSGSMIQMLMGQGMGRYFPMFGELRRTNAAPIPVDNAFLSLLLSSGVIGLILVIYCCTRAWIFFYKSASRSKSALNKSTAGFFSTLPLIALISDLPNAMLLLAMLSLTLTE
jgi:hypothetical protein